MLTETEKDFIRATMVMCDRKDGTLIKGRNGNIRISDILFHIPGHFDGIEVMTVYTLKELIEDKNE